MHYWRDWVPASSHAGQLGSVRYVPSFDGIRALCITAVIAFHVISSDRAWLENVCRRGWCGVDVFFVLSGFLITWIIVDEIDRSGTVDLSRFYGRRVLRLQPAFFSGLLGVSALLFLFHHEKFLILSHAMPYFLTYSLNFALAFGLMNFPPYGQAWSLCIEEQFYLCWPWALRRFGARSGLRIALGIVTFVLIYRSIFYMWLNWPHLLDASPASLDRIYYGTDTRIDTILVGCAAALVLREPKLQSAIVRLREWPWLTTVAAVVALVVFAWATGGAFKGGWRSATIGFTLIALTTALVLVALFLQPQSLLSRCLSCGPLVFVGKLSYGVYLFHDPLWSAVAYPLHLRFGAVGTLPREIAAFLIVWCGSVAIAWLHYRLIEKRFLALRTRFERKPEAAPQRTRTVAATR